MSNNIEAHNSRLESHINDSDNHNSNSLSASALDLLKEGSSSSFAPKADTSVSPRAGHVGPDSIYPDPDLTPGAVFSDVTEADVCRPGYARSVRNVSAEEKAAVFKEYGITPESGKYEIDHFISLELGGSNDISNLWPEPYDPRPGAHEKDKVENYLHKEIVDGKISLKEAQSEIATDWYKVYQEMQNGN